MLFLFINYLIHILRAISKKSHNFRVINVYNISSGENTRKLNTGKTLWSNE